MGYGAVGEEERRGGGSEEAVISCGGQRRDEMRRVGGMGDAGASFDALGRGLGTRRGVLLGGVALAAFVALATCGVQWGAGGAVGLIQLSMVDVSAAQRAKRHDSVSFIDVSGEGGGRGRQAAALAAEAPSGPVPYGHIIHVDIPAAELKQLKVGSIVKGQVRRPMLSQTESGREDFNTIDFTGKVRSLQKITLQGKISGDGLGAKNEGVVTVKMLSDQFIAPGTAVTGMVAGKIFKGTVTKAPSFDERMDEAEKRARELLPPVCDEICRLEKQIAAVQQRIRDFTTSRKLRREAARLEKRTWHLEHPPPPPETVKYVGNWAGFKFDFPQGPNQYGPRIKRMKDRLGKVDYQYAKTLSPLYKKTRDLEKQLDHLEGRKTVQERIERLEQELEHMELCMQQFSRKQCVKNVMAQYGYEGFKGHEADEEEDKARFVKAGEPLDDFEASGDMTPTYDKEEEEEEKEEEEQKGDEGESADKSATQKLSTVAAPAKAASKHAAIKAGAKAGGAWAPGQAAVWSRYMTQASKMDGIHKADNIMANW